MAPPRFYEKYSLGKALGSGSFGQVVTCTRRNDDAKLAVKCVDKRGCLEHGVDCTTEAHFLQLLSHANIVKCHDVFDEEQRVYVVMDKYHGDLVQGLKWYREQNSGLQGGLPSRSMIHVARQVAESVRFLHSQKIMHRDIKLDNYLTSAQDITGLHCRVVLIDFGLSCTFEEGKRFSEHGGTPIYRAPETFARNYGPKVDVWAMGVLMHCLAADKFPFRHDYDIFYSQPRCAHSLDAKRSQFIMSLLEKNENRRPTSEQAARNIWLRGDGAVREQETQCMSSLKYAYDLLTMSFVASMK